MYPHLDPTHALQLANQRNAEDRARAEQWRLARAARQAARSSRQAETAPTGAVAPSLRWQHALGLRWLLGAVRSLRSTG